MLDAAAGSNYEPNRSYGEPAEVFLTPEELSKRWKLELQTLANHRARGTGLSYTKLNGAVRYKLADVLAAERAGLNEGLTVSRVEAALAAAGIPHAERADVIAHLRRLN